MSEQGYGPSWWDVVEAVEAVQARWSFRPLVALSVPFRNPNTGKPTAWGVCVSKPPLPGKPTTGRSCWAYWGKGGAHKTAPAAVLRALLDLEAELDAAKAGAEQLAAF